MMKFALKDGLSHFILEPRSRCMTSVSRDRASKYGLVLQNQAMFNVNHELTKASPRTRYNTVTGGVATQYDQNIVLLIRRSNTPSGDAV